MRVGMIPENILEWLFTKGNALPFPVADTFVAILQARAVLAATRLGLFDYLAKRTASAAELAAGLSCNEKGIQSLLEALTCCGYVVYLKGNYDLTPEARKWLDPGQPYSMNRFIDFNLDNWNWLGHLEENIKTGVTVDIHDQGLDPEGWRRYMYGLHDLARMAAREIPLRFRLKASQRRLLDIGGGHGAYAATYCRRYPHLKSVLFDLPPALGVGEEIISKHYVDVSDRIELMPGDLSKDKLGEGYDVVFLFNVIHHIGREGMRPAFQKIHQALNPGGTFVILDQFKQDSRQLSYAAALTQLLFLVTSNAGSHRLDDVRMWLKEEGFTSGQFKGLRVGPGTALLIATKR